MDQTLIDEIMTRAQELASKKDKKGLKALLNCFDKLYYQPEIEGEVPDVIYDQIVEIYDKNFSKKGKGYHDLKGVGAKGSTSVDVRKDVKLPYYMGTVNKFSAMMIDAATNKSTWRTKPINYKKKFEAWKAKYGGPYTVEGKADGISCLLIYELGKSPKIYSRGTGKTGKDLSRYIKEGESGFNLIPSGKKFDFGTDNKIVVRGELVMRYKTWKRKYSDDFANPRNIVGGFVTKKTNSGVSPRDIDFVAYELLVPRKYTRYEQIRELKKIGFVTVETGQIKNAKDLTESKLFLELKKFRRKSPYEIDGLVVFDDSKVRPVSKAEVLDSAFAYKVNAQTAVVDVVGVEWSSSTTNALKPVVVYKPVVIGREMEDGSIVGATYHRATAFNAAFVKKNKIGPGSKLLIVRSGDVIPHIEEVLKAGNSPDLPNKKHVKQTKYDYKGHEKIDFVWGDGKNRRSTLDIFAVDMLDDAKIQQIKLFFSGGRASRGLDIKGIGKETIKTLFAAGLNSITAILQADIEDFESVGLGKKTSKNIHQAIEEKFKQPVDLALIMGASQIFPHARTRTVRKVLKKYPDILSNPYMKLENVKGVGQDTLDAFLEAVPTFIQFLIDNPQIQFTTTAQTPKIKGKGILKGEKIVFTGTFAKINLDSGKNYTRPELEKLAESLGADVTDKIKKTNNVTLLVEGGAKAGGKKKAQAEAQGIAVMTEDEFWDRVKKVSSKKKSRKNPKKDPSSREYYLPGGDGWDPTTPGYRR